MAREGSRVAPIRRVPLRVSAKGALDAAIVATAQAEVGQAMLHHALLVRGSVPSTFAALLVASGQNEMFWPYVPVLLGVAAGILLVTEAGGIASRIGGGPWVTESPDIVLAAPQLHAAGVAVLE